MPQIPPSSGSRRRCALARQVGATRRVLVSTQRGAHAPRVRFDAPSHRIFFPDIRDEASRTTRGGACAPPATTRRRYARNRAVLPDRRDKPVAGALAIFGIAGQVAPQNFFLVEQSENEDWDHERNHGQRDERAERQRQPEPKEERD